MARGNPNWKKGTSGNPRGRAPILLPEVQKAIDENRNAVKVLILQELNELEQGVPRIRLAVKQIIERSINDGDAVKLKMLLEIALGNLTETKVSELSPEEYMLVTLYRKRLADESKDS